MTVQDSLSRTAVPNKGAQTGPGGRVSGSAPTDNPKRATAQRRGLRWVLFFCLTAALVWLAIRYIDRPVATLAARLHLYDGVLASPPLQAPVLIVMGVLAVFPGGVLTLRGGPMPPWADALSRAILLAGLAMVWGLSLVEFLLKPLFGRTSPSDFLKDGTYAFRWLQQGLGQGSFPSGHAMQITAIVSVLWTIYPRRRALWALAVFAVAALLILAEKHFVSDIIAGTAVGTVAGALMTRVWATRQRHVE